MSESASQDAAEWGARKERPADCANSAPHEDCEFWASIGECEPVTGNPVSSFLLSSSPSFPSHITSPLCRTT